MCAGTSSRSRDATSAMFPPSLQRHILFSAPSSGPSLPPSLPPSIPRTTSLPSSSSPSRFHSFIFLALRLVLASFFFFAFFFHAGFILVDSFALSYGPWEIYFSIGIIFCLVHTTDIPGNNVVSTSVTNRFYICTR